MNLFDKWMMLDKSAVNIIRYKSVLSVAFHLLYLFVDCSYFILKVSNLKSMHLTLGGCDRAFDASISKLSISLLVL